MQWRTIYKCVSQKSENKFKTKSTLISTIFSYIDIWLLIVNITVVHVYSGYLLCCFVTEDVLRERLNNRSAGVKLLAGVPVILAHQEQSLPG